MTLPKPIEVADDRDKTWQQTKSENTRAAILEAALACFYDLGYGATTTEKVAKQAGVSRGAMLHHFPSRQHLVLEAVRHIHSKRLQIFKERELKVNEGAEWLSTSLRHVFNANVLGPEFPVVSRIRNQYHKNILLKIPQNQSLVKTKSVLQKIKMSFSSTRDFRAVRLLINVDNY